MDANETQVDPQNPNPRSAHGDVKETDPLDQIIASFNERWFQGWSATPEEARIKFINIIKSIQAHPDFETKYKNNPDKYAQEIVLDGMFNDVILQRRKEELELYKMFAQDDAFKLAWKQSVKRMLDSYPL